MHAPHFVIRLLKKTRRGLFCLCLTGWAGGVNSCPAQTPAWAGDFNLPGVNGPVWAMAETADAFYYGGEFTKVGTQALNNILRLDKGTGVVSPLGTATANGLNGAVTCLLVMGDVLYIGGGFTSVANGDNKWLRAPRIIKWSLTSQKWLPMGNSFGSGPNGEVLAMAAMGTDLYVAGYFVGLNGAHCKSIAKWSTTLNTWSVLGSPSQNGLGVGGNWTWAYSLAVRGTDLYVGGGFTAVNSATQKNLPVNRIAQWNTLTETWSALGSATQNGVASQSSSNASVKSLLVRGDELFAAGSFDRISSAGQKDLTANSLARWQIPEHKWAESNHIGADGTISSLMMAGHDLYFGGEFTSVREDSRRLFFARNVARWDLETNVASLLGSPSSNGTEGRVLGLFPSGSKVHVMGSFPAVAGLDGVVAGNTAAWHSEAQSWQAIPGLQQGEGVNGPIYTMLDAGPDIYVGGSFRAAGNVAVNHVARWNKATRKWSALGDGSGNGAAGRVNALAMRGDDLFVGGAFSQVGGRTGAGAVPSGGIPASGLAKWNRVSGKWTACGSETSNGVLDFLTYGVKTLAIHGTDLLVGGDFLKVGSRTQTALPANRIAQWSLTQEQWTPMGTVAQNGTDATVHTLCLHGGQLYVGGEFQTVSREGQDSLPVHSLAVWDFASKTWNGVGGPLTNGTDGGVYSLLEADDQLYVGGVFTAVASASQGALPARNIARWNRATQQWALLGTEAHNGTNAGVSALCRTDGGILAGGSFTLADSRTQTEIKLGKLGVWKTVDEAWQPVGRTDNNGTSGGVLALAYDAGEIYAGGTFSNVRSTANVISSSAFAISGRSYGRPAIGLVWGTGTAALAQGHTVPLETAGVQGIPRTRTLTLINRGTGDLTNLAVELDGAHAADFAVRGLGVYTPVILPGDHISFQFVFTPAAPGPRQAAAHLLSNAAGDTNPFNLFLTGTGATPVEGWRDLFFGTSGSEDIAADDADYNGNGIPNLLEYALGGDPAGDGTGTGILPQMATDPAGHLQLSFSRPPYRSDVALCVQAGVSLSGPWMDVAQGTGEEPFLPLVRGTKIEELANGTWRRVTVTDPMGPGNGHRARFLRLKVKLLNPPPAPAP